MSKQVNVGQLLEVLEKWVPKHYAFDWDSVGLQIGSYDQPISKVMVTLDVNEAVVDEAIENDIDLIIAHHPLLFKPIKKIDTTLSSGRILQKALTHNINIYASHTNLDIVSGGVNDLLSDQLGLIEQEILVPTIEQKFYKLSVYTPVDYAEPVYQTLANNGAGSLGDYSHCSFQSEGTATFKPLSGSQPFIGQENEQTTTPEVKIEMLVTKEQINALVKLLHEVHPYEQPAFDVIELANRGEVLGLGRIGRLTKSMDLLSFAEYVKEQLSVPGLRIVGDQDRLVEKVAVLGGSGEKYISQAKKMGADVFVTGDITFHQAQDADALGLALVDPGHHVEKVMVKAVSNYLNEQIKRQGYKVEVINSLTNTEPFQFV